MKTLTSLNNEALNPDSRAAPETLLIQTLHLAPGVDLEPQLLC